MRQRRRVCPDCGLENVYRTPMAGGNMPDGNCIKCGSPNLETVEFEGAFDYSTDPALVASIMAGISYNEPDRAGHVGRIEVSAMPAALASEWPPAWTVA